MVCTNKGDLDSSSYSNGGITGYNGSSTHGNSGGGIITIPVVVASPCKKVQKQIEKFTALAPALVTLVATTSQSNENGIFIDNTATATTPNLVQNIPTSLNTGGALELNPTPANPYVMIATRTMPLE